jgi:recombination protein RecR
VEDDKDVIAMEKMREYKGLYHVLHGSISPMDGIGPALIPIGLTNLEIYMAVDSPSKFGFIAKINSLTSSFSRLVKPIGIKVTRLAQGLSVGGDLEYADEVTLSNATATPQIK